MTVRVLLFAAAKEIAGTDHVDVDLPDQATVADLKRALADQFPGLRRAMAISALAIDRRYTKSNEVLKPEHEVALIPPVSGG
ncbi:MAG TPA: molybdopterin converting factor subunit 1 [Pirellulaceae bacterium]|nr:molybdopterin converting factor subunit 1 [Pirellulaceae bacterium]